MGSSRSKGHFIILRPHSMPVKSRNQAIYITFFQFPVLEKEPRIEYNSCVVDSRFLQIDTSAR
jgi:hypothetical protein